MAHFLVTMTKGPMAATCFICTEPMRALDEEASPCATPGCRARLHQACVNRHGRYAPMRCACGLERWPRRARETWPKMSALVQFLLGITTVVAFSVAIAALCVSVNTRERLLVLARHKNGKSDTGPTSVSGNTPLTTVHSWPANFRTVAMGGGGGAPAPAPARDDTGPQIFGMPGPAYTGGATGPVFMDTGSPTEEWTSTLVYAEGTLVTYQGMYYKAAASSMNANPVANRQTWIMQALTPAWRGSWESTITYAVSDVVTSPLDGGTYMAIRRSEPGSIDPAGNIEAWVLLPASPDVFAKDKAVYTVQAYPCGGGGR